MVLFREKSNMLRTEITLGVDIGGTNTVFGYVDRKGRCLATQLFRLMHINRLSCSLSGSMKMLELLKTIYEKCKLVGIGIGAPNANYYTRTIEHPPNLSWEYVNVVAEMDKYYNVPVATTNDANAAALGEMFFGIAQGMRDFIVITLGTGLGSGIVANGELIYGADGNAGEIGHTVVDPRWTGMWLWSSGLS
jgi:glucokinase